VGAIDLILSRFRSHLRRQLGDFAELAFPTGCPACGTVVNAASMLCNECDGHLMQLRYAPCCVRCASPLPDEAGPCGRCKDKGLPPFLTIARLSTFESVTRDLVHATKYGKRWPIVPWMAELLARNPHVVRVLDETDVVVPVPLHWWRQFQRGFNQAELLAQALAKSRRLPVVRAVRRVRYTTSQTAFNSRVRRRRNLQHAFKLILPELVDGRRVLLIDDVMTSGATLQAMARAIKLRAKPKSFSAVVIATANPLKTDLVGV
jgi:ComF family protein